MKYTIHLQHKFVCHIAFTQDGARKKERFDAGYHSGRGNPSIYLLSGNRRKSTENRTFYQTIVLYDACNFKRWISKIRADEILYIESVDRRTFLYTPEKVYEAKEPL